jgi:hypothetical protein
LNCLPAQAAIQIATRIFLTVKGLHDAKFEEIGFAPNGTLANEKKEK